MDDISYYKTLRTANGHMAGFYLTCQTIAAYYVVSIVVFNYYYCHFHLQDCIQVLLNSCSFFRLHASVTVFNIMSLKMLQFLLVWSFCKAG